MSNERASREKWIPIINTILGCLLTAALGFMTYIIGQIDVLRKEMSDRARWEGTVEERVNTVQEDVKWLIRNKKEGE